MKYREICNKAKRSFLDLAHVGRICICVWKVRFGNLDFPFALRDEIMRRTQGKPVADYLTCMQALFERLNPFSLSAFQFFLLPCFSLVINSKLKPQKIFVCVSFVCSMLEQKNFNAHHCKIHYNYVRFSNNVESLFVGTFYINRQTNLP